MMQLKVLGGHPQAFTPNLDSLAQQGVRFTAANCNAPICGPSRASLITGLYPHTSGMTGYEMNKNKPEVFPTTQNLPWMFEHFETNGYSVYGSGKIFHGGRPVGPGFTDWGVNGDQGPWGWDGVTMNGATVPRGFNHSSLPVDLKVDYARLSDIPTTDGNFGWFNSDGSSFNYVNQNNRDLMNDEVTVEYVDSLLQLNHTDPFFITAGIVRPHAPYIAPDEFFAIYDTMNIQLPSTLPNDLDDVSTGAVNNSPGYGVASGTYENFYEVDSAGLYHKEWIKAYLANVSYADHNIGEIIRSLNNSAYANNTLVIFTSDHGYHMGEKLGAAFKNTAWHESTRVPFVMYGDGVVAGQECTKPITNVDIYSTMVDYAGISTPAHIEGSSLVPLAANPNGSWSGPNVAITSVMPRETGYPLFTPNHKDWSHYSARSENYRYILTSNDEEELYNKVTDPQEWYNLADNPAYDSVKLALRNEVITITGRRPFVDNKINILYNGSFEDHLAGWTPQQTGNSVGEFSMDSVEKVHGVQAFHYDVQVLDNPWNTQIYSANLAFEVGQEYKFSFWAKAGNNGSEIKVQAKENDLNITLLNTTQPITNNWVKYEYTFTSTFSSHLFSRILLQLLDVDDYYIDDVKVEKVIQPIISDCNGDFEAQFDKWVLVENNTADVNYSIDSVNQYEGDYAGLAEVIALGSNPWHQQMVINPREAGCIDTILQGQTYELGFYAKHNGGAGDIKVPLSTLFPVITKFNNTYNLDGNWTKYSHQWTSDTNISPDSMRIKFQFLNTGSYMIDSVYFRNIIDCNGDANGSAYYDDCAVCVGGNTGLSPCVVDCNGDPGGSAFIDSCATCVGGNTGVVACIQDCNNEYGGLAYLDSCSTCVGGSTGLSPCLVDCNGDPGGSAFIDSCSTCVGGNTGVIACIQDCNNEYGGIAYLDSCSTCVGGSTGILACVEDCNLEWGGSAFIDSCNVCADGSTGIVAITDETQCNVGISTGVNELINVYPNPSTNEFIIENKMNSKIEIKVISILGEVIEELIINENVIIGNEYSSGVYFITIKNFDNIQNIKLIKK